MTDAEDHVRKADAALAAAIEAKARLDERWPDGAESVTYLLAHGSFLDLLQIVNTHANLASAKALTAIHDGLRRSSMWPLPPLFNVRDVPLPGEKFVGAKDPAGMGGAVSMGSGGSAVSTELAAVRAGLCPIHRVALVDGRCPESVPHPLKNEHPHGRWEEWRDDGKCIVKSCHVWREGSVPS